MQFSKTTTQHSQTREIRGLGKCTALTLALLSIFNHPLVYAQQVVEQVRESKIGDSSGGSGGGGTDDGGQCVWVAAYAGLSEKDGDTKNHLKHLQNAFDYTDKKAVPGCFGDYWSQYCKGLDNRGVRRERDGSIERYGACRTPRPRNPFLADSTLQVALVEFLRAPVLTENAVIIGKGGRVIPGSALPKKSVNAYYWFMDSQCQYRNDVKDAKLCGFAGVAPSPISLIFDESTSLESDMTVVDFPLDPYRQGSHSLWKGSDKAPLLVYDPEKSGNVASATKLFGNYTFGGRTAELSRISLDSKPNRPTWSNGYEALALLDSNHDGKVSGAELEPIALWFDTNRDARSDSGEVKSLASVGITALYYLNPLGRAGSDDIGLELGYERVVDGRVVQGRSVDWYGETFSSRAEAAQALGAMLSANADRARLELQRDWREDPLSFKPRVAKNHATDLSGFWRWHMIDDESASNPGAFAFEQSDDLSLKGFSVVETVLQSNAQDLRSSVALLPAQGTIEVDAKGRRTLKLTVTNPENGSTAETTATIEEDGVVLRGKTVQKFISSTQPNAKSATLTYEWVAQKFVADAGESKS